MTILQNLQLAIKFAQADCEDLSLDIRNQIKVMKLKTRLEDLLHQLQLLQNSILLKQQQEIIVQISKYENDINTMKQYMMVKIRIFYYLILQLPIFI